MLVRLLQPSLFAFYSNLSSIGVIFGHLSSLGSDGRLYSELIAKPTTKLRLKNYFTHIPAAIIFSILVSFLLQYVFSFNKDILFSDLFFICSIIFLQPLLSNVIAISSAKLLFLQVDVLCLLPSLARLLIVLYLYHYQGWRFLGITKFPFLMNFAAISYIILSLLGFLYSFKSISRKDNHFSQFMPRSYIVRARDISNYLICSISSLAPCGLLLPLVMHFSSRASFDFAPSLALTISFVTIAISISQQYWMRLKMNTIQKGLAELGLLFFRTSYFKWSVVIVILIQTFIVASLYFIVPFALRYLNLDGYEYFRLFLVLLLPFLIFSSASVPFSHLFSRVELIDLRTRYLCIAAFLSISLELFCILLGWIPLACVALSLYPSTLLFFFLRNSNALLRRRLISPI